MKPRSLTADAGLLGADLLAVGAAAHGLQHQVVELRLLGRLLALERDADAVLGGFGAHGLGLQHDVVEARRVELLPDLDQVAVGALHQAVEHLDHVEPRAQGRIDRAHLEPDDAAAEDQHALGFDAEFERAGGVDHARILRHEGQVHGLRTGRDHAMPELDRLRLAGGGLAVAGGLLHLHMEGHR